MCTSAGPVCLFKQGIHQEQESSRSEASLCIWLALYACNYVFVGQELTSSGGGGGELAVRIATILENNGTVCSMLVEK